MKKVVLILLITIFSCGIVLRFYKLGDVPVGLHRDEAILGYNAWSILKTGRDMSGTLFPLHFASYIYSPAGYSYASIPFLALFGLTPFAVRFASAFFGSLTILVTFFMVWELLKNKNYAASIALLAAGALSLSPWHINLSRTATENTLVVFFVTTGVYLYTLWVSKNKGLLLPLSYLSFGITLTIYQAPRAFLPLFIPFLFIAHHKNFKGLLANILLYVAIILIPLFFILSSPNLSLRLSTVSIFGTQQTKLIIDEQIREDGVMHVPLIFTRALHNKLVGYSEQFLSNYFAHFSYPFLFTDNVLPMRYKVPGAGLLYLIELPLLILGMWHLIKNEGKITFFIIGWILLAPIGSALTFDDIPNLQRTLLVQPAISVIIAYGIYSITKIKRYTTAVIILVSIVYIAQFTGYLHDYYIQQVIHQPYYRNEGYKELVSKVNTLLPQYSKAVITNRETAPTIFFLFYGNYNPKLFQEDTQGSIMKDFDRINFGRYEFTTEECPVREIKNGETAGEKGTLYVNYGTCKTPSNATEVYRVLRSDNTEVFKIVTIK